LKFEKSVDLSDKILQLTLKKLYIEPTTRCNFRCEMCVKQSSEQNIKEGDMSLATFQRLLPHMSTLDAVFFSGIGEPTLHPDLPGFIKTARMHLPTKATIGLQSNGSLLTASLFNQLVNKGLNRICLSIDTVDPTAFQHIRKGGEFDQIDQAIHMIQKSFNKIELGVEFVLMRKNLHQLPKVIQWAADQQIDFVIVTQMLPYNSQSSQEIAYGTNTDVSREIFQKNFQMIRENYPHLKPYMNFERYLSFRWHYKKTPHEEEFIQLIEAIKEEAFLKDIPFHINNLFSEDLNYLIEIEKVFSQAQAIADNNGVALNLPSKSPMFQRKCNFVEDGSAFISWFGSVHPCYFLWHQYACFLNNNKKQVQEKSFGDVNQQELKTIWQTSEFRDFRHSVLKYDYPYCNDCKIGPCDLVTDETFAGDCYTIEVPCGHCPWGSGLLQCLQ
jgi:putative metalloenzyme radical SAM/SPASM domain maturase